MASEEENIKKSLTWLQENYSHIWFSGDLTLANKAGFLAACCDTRRCCLAQYSLKSRIAYIEHALQWGLP